MKETHKGETGAHEAEWSLTGKVLRMGLYWQTMHKEVEELTERCIECQTFFPTQRLPSTPLTSIFSPWSFHQWGIDIVGSFPEAPRRVKFLVVVVDCFTKWIEAELVTNIIGRAMIKFMWKTILTCFGTPRTLISDNGLQFTENIF